MIKEIQDIKPRWLNLVRRLQSASASSGNNGHAIIQISIIVDKNGNPEVWSEPRVIKLEPLSRTEEFLRVFCDFQ